MNRIVIRAGALILSVSSVPAYAQTQPASGAPVAGATSPQPATAAQPGALAPAVAPPASGAPVTHAAAPYSATPYAAPAPQPYAAQPYAAPGATAPAGGAVAPPQPQPLDTGAAPPAFVRDPRATGHSMISVFGMLGYGYGFATGYGLGARYQLVVADKLVKHEKIHDELGIEFGVDYLTATYDYGYAVPGYSSKIEFTYREITPVVGIDWIFWINNRFAIYPKVDLGYHITSWSVESDEGSNGISHADVSALYFQGAGGLIFRATPSIAIRAEGGWRALRVGAGLSI